jgi:uncharacterized membrane protein YqjE
MLLRDSRAEPPETGRSIFGLIEELLAKTTRLLDQKLTLLRIEVEESVGTLLRHVAVLIGGGVVAGLGLVLGSFALALWIGDRLGSAAAGFAVTGGVFLVIGVAVIAIRLQRGVGPKRLVPERTMKELERDTRWIKNAL